MCVCGESMHVEACMHNLFIRLTDSKESRRRRVFVQSVMAVFMLSLIVSHRLGEGKATDCISRYFIDTFSQEISIYIKF